MTVQKWRHYAEIRVLGRPATFATAHEAAWKDAVRSAIRSARLLPARDVRFRVAITFYTTTPTRPDERWDLDNLVKPTLDAMEGIFGLREWRGIPQPQDDRVDELVASKEPATDDRSSGAMIEVWVRAVGVHKGVGSARRAR